MGVVLVRIDDRLVHGQVVEGWLRSIRASRIVVASDSVSADETRIALYWLAIPHGIQFSCLSLADTAVAWAGKEWIDERVLVLVASPQEVLALVEKGVSMDFVNVGGLHYRDGRVQILKAVSVDNQDVQALKTLIEKGVRLEARALPLDEPVDLGGTLDHWQQDRETLREQPR